LLNTASGQPFIFQVGLPGSLSEGPASRQLHDDCMYLQTQGLYLTLTSLREATNDNDIIQGIVSSFLLYNLGLVSQLHSICGLGIGACEPDGIAFVSDSFQFRRYHAARSRTMYMNSRLILQKTGVATQQATGIPLLDLLSMALYNNEACAAFADNDYDTCRTLFQMLESFKISLLSKAAHSHWNDETAFIMNRYMGHFLLNALTLKKPDFPPAA